MRLSYLAQDRLDLVDTSKPFAQWMCEPKEIVFPLTRAGPYLVGKPEATIRFRRHEHVDKTTVFVDSDFAGDPASRKSTAGLVAQISAHTVKSGYTLQLYSAELGERRSSWTILETCLHGSWISSEKLESQITVLLRSI